MLKILSTWFTLFMYVLYVLVVHFGVHLNFLIDTFTSCINTMHSSCYPADSLLSLLLLFVCSSGPICLLPLSCISILNIHVVMDKYLIHTTISCINMMHSTHQVYTYPSQHGFVKIDIHDKGNKQIVPREHNG
jgi:hypothetical protein